MLQFQLPTLHTAACLIFVCLCAPVSGGTLPSEQTCGQSTAAISDPEKETKSPKPGLPEDRSLTPAEYTELGMAPDDRQWTGDDLAQALKVLKSLSEKSPEKLPRFESGISKGTFSKLISTKAFSIYRDRSLPIGQRFQQTLTHLDSSNRLMQLYSGQFEKKVVGDSDVIELAAATLRISAVIFELTEELLPTFKKDDPSFQARMNGLAKMKNGLAIMLGGFLDMITEKHLYRASERIKLLGYLKETLPGTVGYLTPDSRTELLAKLQKLSNNEELKELQPGLNELNAAARKPKGKRL